MLDFIKTKKTYLLLLAVLFVFVTLSETTYSLFLTSNEVAELNYNTGLLDLKFTEDEQITLEKTLPIADSDAVSLKPYILKIQNVGNLPYLFDLSLIATNESDVIDSRYIKVKVNDGLPNNLFSLGNKISTNNIIYPGEEKQFEINVWLDETTPNTELGKSFVAKVVTSGSAIYKTLDNSGVNHPDLKDEMIPVYYDDSINSWRIADKTNMNNQNKWYDYSEQKWANAVTLKDSSKKVYDITRNNDLDISNLKINNGNLIVEDNYLNIGLSSFSGNNITNIFRVKFNDLYQSKIYLISNGNFSYYYDVISKKFSFKNDDLVVSSNVYAIEKDKWYLIGYSYDTEKVSFYVNGVKIGTFNISGKINKANSDFLVATDSNHTVVSKIIIGNILIYNRILKDNEIANNYKDSINIVRDGLLCGYSEFTPMTIKEYYFNSAVGTVLDYNDVSTQLVWIPRYKYRVWNLLGTNGSSYDAYNNGIDIVFESSNRSTGEISCLNDNCTVGGIAVVDNDNGKYYTHPAFGDSLGFWISKYELSTDDSTCSSSNVDGCTSISLPVQIKEGNIAWRNNYLENYYKVLYNSDLQIIKNIEWAAVAYLSHSKYGVCVNNACQEIVGNDTYVSGHNKKDTTTGNIYGVFDMAGGAMEYTMSNYSNNGKLNSTFNGISISSNDYELYGLDTFKLGDATKEIMNNGKLWNNSTYTYYGSSDEWIVRGGDGRDYKGIFAFTTMSNSMSDNLSTRIIVK